MKSVGQILDELRHVEVGVKCRKCGAVPMLVGKQYSVRCAACGTVIKLTPNYLARLKEKNARARYGEARPFYRCNVCRDWGYVIVQMQVDDVLASYGYRCMCAAGQNRDDIAAWPVLPENLARQYQLNLGPVLDTTNVKSLDTI